MGINAVLANVRRQKAVRLDRVCVLVCPPTAAWRVRADRALPDRILRLAGWESDFLRTMALERFVRVEDYWREVGRPVAEALEAVSRLTCTLHRDVSFPQFAAVCQSDGFDVVFLVAHHVVASDSPEFSDGPKDIDKVYRVAGRASVIWFCCTSAEWRNELVARSSHRSAAGGAPYRMPFRETMLFLVYWLRAFDGCRTLDEAHAHAVRVFTDRHDDEVPSD